MIASGTNIYQCGSSDSSSLATLVCYAEECTHWAFVCGLPGCSGRVPHLRYLLLLVEGMAAKVH